MLVLSRRPGQSVTFPTLGITVQLLQAGRGSVRLGIDAPPGVHVLRAELLKGGQAAPTPSASDGRVIRGHRQRGQLNTAMMALFLAEKQFQAGQTSDGERSLQEALRALEALDQAAARPPEETRPAPETIGALLVEDDRNEEALLAGYLRMSGFRIETVHDGEEALEFLSRHGRPDFVLLDMRLPRRDGPSTVAAIRQNEAYRGVRIFAVTGTSPEEAGVTTGPGGVDGWFRKPLNPARIVEAMNAAIHNN
jgi:carbon storage regulator CsrA